MSADRRVAALFIVTLGVFARMLTFQSPLFDHHAWRQADTATIARNFYREGLDVFHPQIDARGERPNGYVATGLELHAIVFALVSRLTGYSPAVGRIVSAACFPLSAALLWSFCRRRYGEDAAFIAVFAYALCLPLVLYAERAVWNEPLLILLSFAALASAQRLRDEGRPLDLVWAALSCALVGAIKPQWLIVLAPIAALWFERDRWKILARWQVWVIAAAGCGAAAASLWHMRQVEAQTGLSFGAADKLFHLDDMTLHVAYIISRRIFKDLLGPLGLIAYFAGLWWSARQRKLVELAGAFGFVVYLIAASRGNRVHDYYQLAIAPCAAITIPAGVQMLAGARPRARLALLWIMLVYCFARSVSFHSWYEIDQEKVRFCSELQPKIGPRELVLFADYNSSDLLYCLDRKGWLTSTTDMTPAAARAFRQFGASVIVMPRSSAAALAGEGQTIASTDDWLAVRWAKP
jgi:hypothetical protein